MADGSGHQQHLAEPGESTASLPGGAAGRLISAVSAREYPQSGLHNSTVLFFGADPNDKPGKRIAVRQAGLQPLAGLQCA